jgi:hypothetical protein
MIEDDPLPLQSGEVLISLTKELVSILRGLLMYKGNGRGTGRFEDISGVYLLGCDNYLILKLPV